MIPFTLIYHSGKESCRVPVEHLVVPRVGEKVTPPGEAKSLTVLTVDHEIDSNEIWVVLS